jgi:inositol oxygenase
MSWGHDEYLYMVLKDYLPKEALFVIRYHSFYAAHSCREYTYLMNSGDLEMMKWVKIFNQFDLYSKNHQLIDVEQVKRFEYFLIHT